MSRQQKKDQTNTAELFKKAKSSDRKLFLPVSLSDMKERGWNECDFVFVSGDAYVDHPSFAAALLGRLLESHGYKVGIIAQPDWKNADSFRVLGKPRLAFLVSAGAMDSMVSNYTANNKPRSSDAYAQSPLKKSLSLLFYPYLVLLYSKTIEKEH